MHHSVALDSIPSEYDECPNVCGNGFKPSECQGCPVKAENEFFEENLVESLNRNPNSKDKWKDYGLDYLKRCVIDVSEADRIGTPANFTRKTDSLVSVLKAERNRIEKLRREASKSNASE